MNEGLFGNGELSVDISAVKTPTIKTPTIKTPEIKTPEIKTPEIKTPKFGLHQLVVLGNGFDLECGLPTRFCHFFEPRVEALKTQDWKTTGKLDGLGYEATPTVWDFLLRTKTYAPWYSVEEAVSDLVVAAGDGKHGATGIASKLIARISDLEPIPDREVGSSDDGATTSPDEEDLLDSAIEFIAIDCADKLRQSDSPWSPQELVDYLGEQLSKLEDNFSGYMTSICEGNDDYIERSAKLLRWMIADTWPTEGKLALNTTVLSFNYTNPFKQPVGRRSAVRIINVHGSLDSGIIFGIDSTKCTGNPLAFPFSKTYRVMTAGTDFGEGAVHTAGGSLLSLETGVVKFYGHSLGEADYAYFQAIFDSVSLYDSDVKLVFYYKPHVKPGEDSVTSLSDQRAKNTMATRVAKLLAEYGNTLDNENHGRNLMHKLMIEGRLEVRLLKGE